MALLKTTEWHLSFMYCHARSHDVRPLSFLILSFLIATLAVVLSDLCHACLARLAVLLSDLCHPCLAMLAAML